MGWRGWGGGQSEQSQVFRGAGRRDTCRRVGAVRPPAGRLLGAPHQGRPTINRRPRARPFNPPPAPASQWPTESIVPPMRALALVCPGLSPPLPPPPPVVVGHGRQRLGTSHRGGVRPTGGGRVGCVGVGGGHGQHSQYVSVCKMRRRREPGPSRQLAWVEDGALSELMRRSQPVRSTPQQQKRHASAAPARAPAPAPALAAQPPPSFINSSPPATRPWPPASGDCPPLPMPRTWARRL